MRIAGYQRFYLTETHLGKISVCMSFLIAFHLSERRTRAISCYFQCTSMSLMRYASEEEAFFSFSRWPSPPYQKNLIYLVFGSQWQSGELKTRIENPDGT